MGSFDVPMIHIGMIVGIRCVSIKIRPLQMRQKEDKKNELDIYGCCTKKKEGTVYAHAPPEALQSRNPSSRIRLVRIGLTNFTLAKQVYLAQMKVFLFRVKRKHNVNVPTRQHAASL